VRLYHIVGAIIGPVKHQIREGVVSHCQHCGKVILPERRLIGINIDCCICRSQEGALGSWLEADQPLALVGLAYVRKYICCQGQVAPVDRASSPIRVGTRTI
jgi:hypothetical protein